MKKTIVYLIAAIPAMASMSFAQQQNGGGRQRGAGFGAPGTDPTGMVDPRAGGRRGGTGGPGDPTGLGGRRGATVTPLPRVSTEIASDQTPKPKAITDTYKPLLQVSIFSRDRRSSDDLPNGGLLQTVLPDRPDSYYALRGVVMENGEPVAFVENTHDTSGTDGGPGTNAYIHVKVGEPLAGGKVVSITLDQIEFERSESAFSTRVKVGCALNGLEMAPPEDMSIASGGMSATIAQQLMRGRAGRGGGTFDPALLRNMDPATIQSLLGGRSRGGRGGAGGGGFGTGGFGTAGFDPNLMNSTAAFGTTGGGRGGRGGGGGGGRGGRGGGGAGGGGFGG